MDRPGDDRDRNGCERAWLRNRREVPVEKGLISCRRKGEEAGPPGVVRNAAEVPCERASGCIENEPLAVRVPERISRIRIGCGPNERNSNLRCAPEGRWTVRRQQVEVRTSSRS